jgi:hypothetical protein
MFLQQLVRMTLLAGAFFSCTPTDTSKESSAKKPTAGECPQPDPLAVPGVNTKTGECVDLNEFRVVNYLEGKAKGGYLAEARSYNAFAKAHGFKTDVPNFQSHPMIANLKHDGKFWIAQLDFQNVKDVYFQVEEFKINVPKDKLADPKLQTVLAGTTTHLRALAGNLQPAALKDSVEKSLRDFMETGVYTAAHGQVRMDFLSPIPLALQTDPSQRTQVSSIVFSIHAVAKNYDAVKGLQGDYPLALGVFSASEKYNFSVLQMHNNFRQYKINLRGAQLQELMTLYMKQAEVFFRERDYNTFNANCGNIWFETAENAFLKQLNPELVKKVQEGAATNLGRGYPKYAQYALDAYGWLTNKGDLVGEPWVEAPK